MIKALNLVKNFRPLYSVQKLSLSFKLSATNSSEKPGSSSKNDKLHQSGSNDINSDQQNLKNKHGVFVDEERIKSKIKQIKERGEVKFEDQRKKKQQQFMKNYQINRGSSQIRKFRRDTQTQGLMNFEDVSLDQKPTVLQVSSYTNTEIEVDGFPYPPSLVLSNYQLQKLTVDHLKLIELVNPPPQYVIIGCTNPLQVPEQIRRYLEGLGINYDIIEVFEAVSNFNTYSANDVRVLAYLNTTQEVRPM